MKGAEYNTVLTGGLTARVSIANHLRSGRAGRPMWSRW